VSVEQVRLDDHGSWAELVLARPPVNALTMQMEHELAEACARVAAQPHRWRALVLSAEGAHFCVGADIKEFLARADQPYEPKLGQDLRDHFSVRLASLECPTIAALQGYCLGAGLEMALCCDIRIGAPDLRIGLPEVKLGLFPGMGGTQRVPRALGEQAAKRLILTADQIGAEEALRMGAVAELSDDPRAAAAGLAERVAENGPKAVRAAKRCIELAAMTDLLEGLEREQREWAETWAGDERSEGVTAFVEKRPPSFAGSA
jgi:enoyl-CoA hydratase